MEKLVNLNILKRIKHNIYEKPLFDSILELDIFFSSDENFPAKSDFEKIKATFNFMIEYFAQDMPDPQRKDIYKSLKKDLLVVVDKIREYIKAYHQTDYKNVYSHYHQKTDVITMLANGNDSIANNIDLVFSGLMMKDIFDTNYKISIQEFFNDENINNLWKTLVVSAISMSLLRFFDKNKFLLLFDVFTNHSGEAKARAVVGLVLSIFVHNRRIQLYDELVEKIKSLNNRPELLEDIQFVVLQIVKSRETKEIIREFNEDILPGMIKMREDIKKMTKELNFDELEMDTSDDENPGWENYFDENPEFFDRMEKFTMRQFSGSDVFSATLGGMKDFPFFTKISNWFMPFYAQNLEVKTAIEQSIDTDLANKFLSVFEKANYFCNSDKYSFCFHLPELPAPMRSGTLKLLIDEIEAATEMIKEDNLADDNNVLVISYIQDLYRFFNFNKFFTGLTNIFNLNIGIHRDNVLPVLSNYDDILRASAELYFSQKLYKEAAESFEKIINTGRSSADIFEKAAFSYQKQKNFAKALDLYKKAELFDENKKWLFKKIGFCNLKLMNYQEALKFYQEAAKIDPDDLSILAKIARCQTELGYFKDALNNYFKIDYYKPNNVKTMRSIAYCAYKLEKFEQAKNYANRCISAESHRFDFFILGNIAWVENDIKEAIAYYQTAMFDDNKMKFQDFLAEFREYWQFLKDHNIDDFQIQLMVDYLQKLYYQKF